MIQKNNSPKRKFGQGNTRQVPPRLDKLLPKDRLAFKKANKFYHNSDQIKPFSKARVDNILIIIYITIILIGSLLAYLMGGISGLKHFIMHYL